MLSNLVKAQVAISTQCRPFPRYNDLDIANILWIVLADHAAIQILFGPLGAEVELLACAKVAAIRATLLLLSWSKRPATFRRFISTSAAF